MKRLFAIALLSSAAAWACDPYAISQHGGALSRAAQYLQNTAGATPGYYQLANDAFSLGREAQNLVQGASSGFACYQLDPIFQQVQTLLGNLRSAHSAAQIGYPNPTMQQAWNAVENANSYCIQAMN